MLFKGTKLRTATQLIRRLEEIGGELNAYTSKEETILYALCPRAYAQRALQLMADIVQHSVFASDELSKEQTVVIDEIHSYEDSPSELIWDEFEDIVFRGHPLGHCILGSEKSVGRFSSEGLKRFHQRHYRLDNMAIFVQGDIDQEHFMRSIELYFSSPKIKVDISHHSKQPLQSTEPRCCVRRKGTHQRHILVGASAYDMFDERRLGLSLLVNILGGPGMSSRLNMSLREQEGLVYQVDCSYTSYSDTGLVAISFGCAAQSEARARELVDIELRRMAYEPMTQKELDAAKRQLKGQLMVASDNHENYFLSLGKAYLHQGRVETLEEIMRRIDDLQLDALQEIAREIFPPERMYTLIYR